MPPYVETDCHHDEWHLKREPLLAPDSESDEPSPLFRDTNCAEVPPRSFGLDCRMSDPDFRRTEGQELVSTNDPAKKALVVAAAPVVSRITAIIGPESAYVRTTNSADAAPPLAPSAAGGQANTNPAPKKNQQQQLKTSPTQSKDVKGKKLEGGSGAAGHRPILLRATRYVSKKGWKVVKSLPNRVASTARTVKVPGHHRNVV